MTDLEQIYREAYVADWDDEAEFPGVNSAALDAVLDYPWLAMFAAAGLGFALALAVTPARRARPTPPSQSRYREHDLNVIPEGGPDSLEAIAADALNP